MQQQNKRRKKKELKKLRASMYCMTIFLSSNTLRENKKRNKWSVKQPEHSILEII
jgi:hypothetical protein